MSGILVLSKIMNSETFESLEDFIDDSSREYENLELVFKRQAEFVLEQDEFIRETGAMIEILRDKRDRIWDEIELMECDEEYLGRLVSQVENSLKLLENSYNSIGYNGECKEMINKRQETFHLFDKLQDGIKYVEETAENLKQEVEEALKELRQSFPLPHILHCHTVALTNLENQLQEMENLSQTNEVALNYFL